MPARFRTLTVDAQLYDWTRARPAAGAAQREVDLSSPTCCRPGSPRWTSRWRRRSRTRCALRRARRPRLRQSGRLRLARRCRLRRAALWLGPDPEQVTLAAPTSWPALDRPAAGAHRARRRRGRHPARLSPVLQPRSRRAGAWSEVPLGRDRELDLDAIERAFAEGARALMLCNPHNPTGARAVARRARGARGDSRPSTRPGCLADEIHAPLALPGAEHVPFLPSPTRPPRAGSRSPRPPRRSTSPGSVRAGRHGGEPAAGGRRASCRARPRHCGHLGAIATVAAYRSGDEWLDAVIARPRREPRPARRAARRAPARGRLR